MATICSQCSHVNPDQSGFCIRCGNRLPAPGQTGQFAPGPFNPGSSSTSFPTYISPQSAPPTLGNGNSGGSLPTYVSAPPPSSPSTGTQLPSSFPSNTGYLPPSGPTNPAWSTSTLAPPPPGPQMGIVQSTGSFRRAFAGHGLVITHYSWLLTGDHAHASAVRDAFRDKMRQRNVSTLMVNPEMLTERGLLMEQREYVVAQRGAATIFAYMAPVGQDLYISRATTVLPVINILLVAFHCLLALIMFIGFVSRPSPDMLLYGNFTGYILSGIFTGLSYPILLYFIVFFVRAFTFWLFEKDFWRYLRFKRLHDFQLDDIVLLEHLTDNVVHEVVEQIGLDASKIIPPPLGYKLSRKIRPI